MLLLWPSLARLPGRPAARKGSSAKRSLLINGKALEPSYHTTMKFMHACKSRSAPCMGLKSELVHDLGACMHAALAQCTPSTMVRQ